MSLVDKVMIVDSKGKKRAINRRTAESERMQTLHEFEILNEPVPAPVDFTPKREEVPTQEEVKELLGDWNVKKLKGFAENIEGYKSTLNKEELINLIADQPELYSVIKND